LGLVGQKNRCKSRRLNRWLIWSMLPRLAFTHV
jgi:hypothetical protein